MKKIFSQFTYSFLLLILLISNFNCSGFKSKKDIRDLKNEILKEPVRHLENYDFSDKLPLSERVKYPPDLVLKYLREFDDRDDYTPYLPNEDEYKKISSDIKRLPILTRRVLKKRLIGIYFINNFRGNGFAEWVADKNDKIYAFLVFNSAVLKKNLPELVTDKERTCFVNNDKSLSISIECSEKLSGFLYIFLHESAHVVDYVLNLTPYTEKNITYFMENIKKETEFTRGVWKDYNTLPGKFQLMKNVTFYGFSSGPKVKITDAAALYRELSVTPLVSLYSSLNWAEDVVELLTFYHLTEKLKSRFIIKIIKNSEEIYRLEPMKNPLVRRRFPLLKRFYN